jgi:cytochrome P450
MDIDLGPVRRGSFFPLLGNGIFTQDGIPWGRSRGIIRPQFSRAQISDLDLEERHVQNMMRVLDLSINANKRTGQVDLQVLFFRLTLDTATEFLFGQSADSQIRAMPRYDGAGAENDQEADFATAFDKSQMGLAMRIRFGLKYWLYNTKEFRDSCRTCHKFVDQFVQLALSKQPKEKENMPKIEEVSTPEKYVFLEALASQTQDPIELRSQVLQLLLAGRDTTASLLGWLFFCLARDPVRFQRLRDAIIQEFGDYDKPMEITFSNLKGCNYLQYCMNETLRLYPLVPQNGRYANKDTTLPRGGGRDGNSPIFIPKGTSCTYSVHVMHHRKDIWGSDAEDFNPERWEKRKVGWDYLPVGICWFF